MAKSSPGEFDVSITLGFAMPIIRLKHEKLRVGRTAAWRLARVPTYRSPFSPKATTVGVEFIPSILGTTTVLPPIIAATTDLLVPKSIPIAASAGRGTDAPVSGGAGCVFDGRTVSTGGSDSIQ